MTADLRVLSTFAFSQSSLQMIREIAQVNVLCVTKTEELLAHLRETEVLCSYWLPDNWQQLATHLRWLQAAGAGVDTLGTTGILGASSAVMVTTAIGINAISIAEYVFGSILMFNRNWPEMVRLQDRQVWPHSASWYKLEGRELVDQTLGVVGLGSIGRRIARLARAFGMHVLGTRRSAQSGDQDPDVDGLYPQDRLQDMLRQCDYVVLAVPLTPETEHLISEAELRAMRPHTYLVNVARGRVVDEKNLVRALREGWIAGAGLDVTAEEPLPADSPLFAMRNVILTPHISGVSVHYDKRLATLFAENLRRYRAGEPLQNRYELARGY